MIKSVNKIVNKYLQKEGSGKLVLAISGGVDSMVLWHILRSNAHQLIICHVNHGLRDEESDKDAAFVKEQATAQGLPYFERHIGQELHAGSQTNMHQASRALRYAFFEEIRVEYHADLILTAHHMDDVHETMIHHFHRGTGIKGLQGIPEQNGSILRPMLNVSKEAILNYAQAHQLSYRNDSSNQTTKYTRNAIRLQLIPILQSLYPNHQSRLERTRQNMGATNRLLDALVTEKLKPIHHGEEGLEVDKQQFDLGEANVDLLYHIASPYGFNIDQCRDLVLSLADHGQKFDSKTHEMFNNKQRVLIRKRKTQKEDLTQILHEENQVFELSPAIQFSMVAIPKDQLKLEDYDACLDYDKLEFPLRISRWKPGDRFEPFGMKGQNQKISKAIKNLKIDVHLKPDIRVMKSGGEIVWLIPYRISNKYSITEETQKALCFKRKN